MPLPVDLTETEDFNLTKARLAIGDLILVKFSGPNVTIPSYEERIKEDGIITLPLIGPFKARGKTCRELEKEISDRSVPDVNPHLSVAVVALESSFFVGGQVRQPGRQIYVGPITITKAIESAGGFTEYAARSAVELNRSDGKKFRVDCRKALEDSSLDRSVFPGDRIDVPMRGPHSDL